MRSIPFKEKSNRRVIPAMTRLVVYAVVLLQILPAGFAETVSLGSQIQNQIPEQPVPNGTTHPVNDAVVSQNSIDFLKGTSPLSAAAAEENKEPTVILSEAKNLEDPSSASQDDPPPQIARTKTKTNSKGQVTSFTEEIRDEAGNLLYTLTRSSIRYDKQGNLISYKDTFKFPDKTSLTGIFEDGIYTLKGTWRSSPNGSQAIERRFNLNSDQRLLIDPDRKETTLIDDTFWTGFGESRFVDDLEVVRYKETQDRSGNLMGFEETVYDAETGEILYQVSRTRMSDDRKTGNLTFYTEEFIFPDGTVLRGTFRNGFYVLRGGINFPLGKQFLYRVLSVPSQNLLVDPRKENTALVDGTLLVGLNGIFQEGVVFRTVRDRVLDPETGESLYRRRRLFIQSDRKSGEMISYRDVLQFSNGRFLTLHFRPGKGLVINGSLEDGTQIRNRVVPEVAIGHDVVYSSKDKLFLVFDQGKVVFVF